MTHIGVTGCALIDYLYSSVDFSSPAFLTYQTRSAGDGGLRPGGLVFASDLEDFAGVPLKEVLENVVGNHEPDAANVGGPAIVAAIHTGQVGAQKDIRVSFYGARGNDRDGSLPLERLADAPLSLSAYRVFPGPTPSTIVLSDPDYAAGSGERCFINTIGAATHYSPESLNDDFFDSDLVLFGGTALVPSLHDRLDECVVRAHQRGAITVIGTVYDFRNEQRAPDKPWPLLERADNYQHVDLLITDHEEALRISGAQSAHGALETFLDWGVGAAVVTRGTEPLIAESVGERLPKCGRIELPISEDISAENAAGDNPLGSEGKDTTGCGDNFVGGALYALARAKSRAVLASTDFRSVLAHGVVAGGIASFHLGGTYREETAGEKAVLVREYYAKYLAQIGIASPGIL